MYLHLETLGVHNSLSDNFKNSNNYSARGRPSLTELVIRMRWVFSCGKSPGSISVGPRSHDCDNKQFDFVTLEFARNADLVGEKGGCTINKWHYFAVKLAKSVNHASRPFFRKTDESYAAKDYACAIYQSQDRRAGGWKNNNTRA